MPRLRTPGPGAYDTPPHLSIGGSPDRRPSAAFASNSSRSSKGGSEGGGDPGAYDLENGGVHMGKKECIASRSKRSMNRDINSGKGMFTSTSSRPTSAPPRSQRGGPGEHDFAHIYSCGNNSQQVTSAFMSAVPLGGHIRKSDTPGIGEYDPDDKQRFNPKSFTKEGSYMFVGAAKGRSSVASTATGEHIGPGSYELGATSISARATTSVNPRLPGFGSSSVRTGPED